MKYINELREGNRMSGVYLCKHKQSAVTKNGKQYENVILQDKTGVIDTKIWDLNNGIDNFEQADMYEEFIPYSGPEITTKISQWIRKKFMSIADDHSF